MSTGNVTDVSEDNTSPHLWMPEISTHFLHCQYMKTAHTCAKSAVADQLKAGKFDSALTSQLAPSKCAYVCACASAYIVSLWLHSQPIVDLNETAKQKQLVTS